MTNKQAIRNLNLALAASCTCNTKTDNEIYHDKYCKYRLIKRAIGSMEKSIDVLQKLAKLFPEEDMAKMDAADFVDRAGKTFELAKTAKQLTKERSLSSAIDEIMAVIPDTEQELISTLSSHKESVDFAPPENLTMWWKEITITLGNYIPGNPKHRSDWQESVWNIWLDTDSI